MIIYVQITYILFIKMLIVYTPIRNIGSFPINKGNFFVPAAPAWKKINKKNRIHMDSPVFGATYPQKKRLKGPKLFFCVMSFPAASSLYCSFFSGIFEFKKWTWCVLWNQRSTRFDKKTKGWTNKHYFKANNHHDIKQLGELSQQPPFNNPSIWREIS